MKKWRIIIRFTNDIETGKPCDLRCLTMETNLVSYERALEIAEAMSEDLEQFQIDTELLEA
ncbi:MAG: hypothetical protein ACKOX6_12885 [Bdellovibrio sp.]